MAARLALDHFAPFVPSDAEPFDHRRAAHLLRRAGFGGSPAEIQQAVDQGLEATVETLFADNAEEEALFAQLYGDLAGSLLSTDDINDVQTFWVHRMVRTRHPLREKLALFWHGHFATSFYKVEEAELMRRQIETLRGLGLGNFRDLAISIARDPAMIVYLDGQTSTKAQPNENFARELMELFTCGIGHYSERDVQEGARAFSGWHRNGAEFFFNAEEHDFDRKEFLGKAGRFDGVDIVDILMQQPATPRFIAAKLVRFFAAEPSPEVLDEAAELLDRSQLDVKWFLRDLFQSRYFYSADCYRHRIASPAEYVIGTVRTLSVRLPANQLRDHMTAMGQELLAPPNVKGWDGEQKWINAATWPARLAFAEQISQQYSDQPGSPHTPLEDYVSLELTEPAQVVEALAGVLMQGELPDAARAALGEYLVATDEGPNPDYYREDPNFRFERNRGALATILGLPEYHAC